MQLKYILISIDFFFCNLANEGKEKQFLTPFDSANSFIPMHLHYLGFTDDYRRLQLICKG